MRACSVNKVVPKDQVLSTALAWAAEIVQNSSPDSVQSTKRALLLANQHGSVEDAVAAHINSKESKRAFVSENSETEAKARELSMLIDEGKLSKKRTYSDKECQGQNL